MMRLSITVLTATLVTGSLVACSNGYGVPPTASTSADGSAQTHVKVLPVELRSSEILAKMHADAGRGGADTATWGIYASEPFSRVVHGYPYNNRSDGPPVCSVGPFNDLHKSDIAVDRKGDLLVADGGANTITIFKGPGLCGPKVGTIADPFGTTVTDVASRDGATIVVGYNKKLVKSQVPGVAVCTLSGGCTRHLSLGLGAGALLSVAVAPNGDCWATAHSYSRHGFFLVFFAHCRGNGVVATGFVNIPPRGLDIDANGNLVTTGETSVTRYYKYKALYVYSGCHPSCTLVGGPFPLLGRFGWDGHLNGRSNKFITTDHFLGWVYVYSYSPTAITWLYAFKSSGVGAAAFSPNSKE